MFLMFWIYKSLLEYLFIMIIYLLIVFYIKRSFTFSWNINFIPKNREMSTR